MFNIKTKVIIESAAVTLTADQIAALAAEANNLRDVVAFWEEHAAPETVAAHPRRVELTQQLLDSISGIVNGAELKLGPAPSGRGRGRRNPSPGA